MAYVAGESGIATLAAVALLGVLFRAGAKVWRPDTEAVDRPERELARVA